MPHLGDSASIERAQAKTRPGVLAILQARVSSSRLPAKVLCPVLGRPMLSRQLERLRRCRNIDKLIVATSDDPSDQPIEDLCVAESTSCFRGSLDDVLDRFYQAAKFQATAHVVRLTGDCPLTDPELIDRVIDFHLNGAYDFTSNGIEPTFPDGLDAAVFRYSLLEQAWHRATLPSQREHVTPYMRQHTEPDKIGIFKNDGMPDYSYMRWTVDEPADLAFVRAVYERLYPNKPDFNSVDIYRLLELEPDLQNINRGIGRNEGYRRSLQKDLKWAKK